MPLVAPFRGLRFNPGRVPTLSAVVTPPYDVISREQQQKFYRRHRYNFIRIVFGKPQGSDTRQRNPYSRARRTLESWVRQNVMRFDEEPSLYPYRQRYRLNGKSCERWGLIGLVRLDSPNVYPHEETRPKPKLDRLRLLESLQASLSPVFGLIRDFRGSYRERILSACRGRRPIGEALLDEVRHTLWKVSDPAWIRSACRYLAGQELYIGDGHHRFEAAVDYRDARRAKDPCYTPSSPYNFSLFYLAAVEREEPGLLPTHRVISGLSDGAIQGFTGRLSEKHRCRVVRTGMEGMVRQLSRLRKGGKVAVGFYSADAGRYILEPDRSPSYRMDVEWLHGELLKKQIASGAQVAFTQDLQEAVRLVRQRKAQALFVMQPVRLEEVFSRARSGVRMPGKTTYFYPKVLAGWVEYKF